MIKLTKNIFFISFGELSSRILNFVTTIFLIRIFTVEEFGNISIATAVFSYAVLISVHWFNTFGVKKIAAGENGNFLSEFTSIRFVLSIIVLMLISVFLLFSNFNSELKYLIFLFSLSLIPNAYFFDWYFMGKETLKPVAFGKLIFATTYLLFLVLFIVLTNDVVNVGLAFLFGNIISALYFLYYFYKDKKILPSLSFQNSLQILKESFPLSSAAVLSQMSANLPILLIGLFLGTADTGIFAAAYKLVFFLLILDRFYYSIFFPALMRIYKFESNTTENLLNSALKINFVFILFIFSILLLNARELLLLIFGINYQDSVVLFQLLLVYFVFTMLNSMISFGLIANNEEKFYSKTVTFSILLNLILMFILIKIYGLIGPALAVGIVEIIIFVTLFLRLKKFVQLKITKYIFQVVLLNSILVIIGVLFDYHGIMLSVIISTLIYSIGIVLFRIITKEDLSIFKEKLWN